MYLHIICYISDLFYYLMRFHKYLLERSTRYNSRVSNRFYSEIDHVIILYFNTRVIL